MRFLILASAFALFTTNAFAYGSLSCYPTSSPPECITSTFLPLSDAEHAVYETCTALHPSEALGLCTKPLLSQSYQNSCIAVFINSQSNLFYAIRTLSADAIANALGLCINSEHQGVSCKRIALSCDGNASPPTATSQAPKGQPALQQPATVSQRQPSPNPIDRFSIETGISFAAAGLIILGIAFLIFLVSRHAPPAPALFKQRHAPGLMADATHIEVLIVRSQRMNWLNRVIFMIDARMGVGAEQLDLISKYRLGKTIVFDSARRERQNELARTHLESARERNTRTICLWREEVRGFFRRLWYLILALISFLLGFLFIRITLAKLIRGTHVESKSLDKILAAKNAIERGAADLKAYLEVAETFDGREDLFEPS
jgi:hypothetical protein